MTLFDPDHGPAPVCRHGRSLEEPCRWCDPAPGEAHARRTDPGTSWAAARSVRNMTPLKRAICDALAANPEGLTDEGIAAWLGRNWPEPFSPSGARSRRADMTTAGLIADSGKLSRLASGRKAIVWVLGS